MPIIKLGKDILQFPDDTDPKTVVHAASSHARRLLMEQPEILEKLTPQERDDVYNIAAVGTKPDLHNFTPKAILENLTQRATAATQYAKDNPLSTLAELAPAAAGMLLPQIARAVKSGMRPPSPGTSQTVTEWRGGNPWSTNAGQTPAQAAPTILGPSGQPVPPSAPPSGAPAPIQQITTTSQLTPPDPGGILRRAGSNAGDFAKWGGLTYLASRFFGSHGGSGGGGSY